MCGRSNACNAEPSRPSKCRRRTAHTRFPALVAFSAANRCTSRIKSGTGFRRKMLQRGSRLPAAIFVAAVAEIRDAAAGRAGVVEAGLVSKRWMRNVAAGPARIRRRIGLRVVTRMGAMMLFGFRQRRGRHKRDGRGGNECDTPRHDKPLSINALEGKN